MKGTTLSDPVMKNQKPDLDGSLHEISEYLDKQRAYDLFDYLVKELLTKQPEDPLQHMIHCLKTEYNQGPLKVVVTSMPGIGCAALLQRLAEHFGLLYVSAGSLLREAGVSAGGLADDAEVSSLVVDQLREADARMQGWLLDGFPRTRVQTSHLNEHSVLPSHVLTLQAPERLLLDLHAAGRTVLGSAADGSDLLRELSLYGCHSSALEPYASFAHVLDASRPDLWAELERSVRTLPRSLAPRVAPRLWLLGPRGVGLRAHASRLAARLDAVFVDGDPQRLRQGDCAARGWVLCGGGVTEGPGGPGGPGGPAPRHVVVLDASVQTCIQRLRLRHTDVITRRVWSTRPRSERIRRRLQRNPRDQPPAVSAEYAAYAARLEELLRGLAGTRVSRVPADGDPEGVHAELVELVERPPPLPARD